MKIRFGTSVVLLMLALCAPAGAAPATVQLRVEGASSTIFEGPVTTDGKTIDKGDGPHPCDGTNGGANPTAGPTMTSALDDASASGSFTWDGTWFDSLSDFGVDRIGPDANSSTQFWGYALNYIPSQIGGCQQRVETGDEVLFGYDFFSKTHLLKLAGPGKAAVGSPIVLTVSDGSDGSAIAGASVAGAPDSAITGPDGSVGVTFDSAGLRLLKADRADSIRSNALRVCVSDTGAGDCGVPPQTLGSPAAAAPGARDTKAPSARISGIRDGARYRRGPRLLRGTASDENGVSVVKLALRRHVAGRPCRWWSGRRERFVGNGCHKRFFFAIGSDANWSYLLPHRLGPGRYVLDVKAFDRARNRDERFVRGQNRVVFHVLADRSARAAGASRARRAAKVGLMVVGRRGVLAAARSLRAAETTVSASGRRCRVGSSTPLAALARVLRRKRVIYHVRDFGHCSSRGSNGSAQLFVDRIGPDRNSGQDGWFYKIGNRAATAGGGDPSGPFGSGLLRDGARVLWFYCLFDVRASSCQRTLGLRPSTVSASAGEPLRVRVRSYDNDGRARPEGGVTVRLGSASALTDAQGGCLLTLPKSGRYRLEAEKAGTVAAFPVPVQVR
jgi:hypothetical protein